ncbi:hypothetical protein Tco_0300639 [Tanacetum coccineum]
MKIAQALIVKMKSMYGRKGIQEILHERGRFTDNTEDDIKNFQRSRNVPPRTTIKDAFIGGASEDNGENEVEKTKDDACLVAQAPMNMLRSNLGNDEWI